jgi:protein-tyrosine phosphatase
MAEFIMKSIVKRENKEDCFFIESRATHTDEIFNGIGNHIYPPAQEIMRKNKIPFDGGKRAELLNKSDWDKFDYFIGMDKENLWDMKRIYGGDPEGKLSLLMDWAGQPGREIDDPWYTRDFTGALRQIEAGCRGLLGVLKHE